MKTASRIIVVVTFLNLVVAICFAQTETKDASASISGRITIAGKAAADISVTASIATAYDRRSIAKATTDEEGNYRLTGLSAGRIYVMPVAKAYAISSRGHSPGQAGRTINLLAGEEITKIDFALSPGGVITGRITDADGSPIIGEPITLLPFGPQDTFILTSFGGQRNHTDDRGIYRTYGIAPGKYKVSVGQATSQGVNMMHRGSRYIQTFYPGVQDESQATVVEVKEGGEVKDVDIQTRKGSQGFKVSGRVVDSTTGQPVPKAYVGYGLVEEPKKGSGMMNFASSPTDANGKFSLEGLGPGQYTAFTLGVGPENTSYSEPSGFEIIDGDVSGVEVKVSKGATISGIAVVENNVDPAVTAVLSTINLHAYAERKPGSAPSFAHARINADGTFKFSGLAPGKIRLVVQEYPTPPKGLSFLRVEVNGVDQREGIDVTAGAEIRDVRLVFSHGGGSLRGTVKVVGGTLPEGAMFWAQLSGRPDSMRPFRRHIEVDSRGRFSSENIPPGTYELTLNVAVNQQQAPGFPPVKQTITITHGVETEVILEVNLTGRKEGSN
ncbi:MAG TPA: carboxypeptidase regulatory-like domain-containing protein [Pyrinomonadaceae bacterium]|nr:carboxypeptidase regulatory-like domain-containing protein [Pyrinomonadaceae bacterium]